MARLVWFKFSDKSVDSVPLTDGVDAMCDLREAIVAKYLMRAVRDRVKLYASPEAQRAARPLHLESKVDGLGLAPEHPIMVGEPRLRQIPPCFVIMHGLRLETPRIERKRLLDRVSTSLLRYPKRFVLFAAPSGSGKTSLLLLFAHKHSELKCAYVPLITEARPTNEALRDKVGLDICGRQCALSQDEQRVILIDDAETKYEDRAFRKALITDAPSWLPSNVRFVSAADHALDGGVESPIEFQSLITFGRSDFLLRDEEAYELLTLPFVGFSKDIKCSRDKLSQLSARDCGPHWRHASRPHLAHSAVDQISLYIL